MRSERLATTLRLCSTISTVRSAATDLMSALMRSMSSWPMPAIGSSSRSISGSSAKVVAISSARLGPYGNATAVQWAKDDKPTSAISAIARSLKTSSTRFERQKSNDDPRCRCSAMRTFSSTVRCGKTAEIWNDRTSPSRATPAGGERRDVATLVNDPSSGRPHEFRQKVETRRLAGAIGSDQRMNLAACNLQADPVDRNEAGKFLGEILGVEDEIVAHDATALLIDHSVTTSAAR